MVVFFFYSACSNPENYKKIPLLHFSRKRNNSGVEVLTKSSYVHSPSKTSFLVEETCEFLIKFVIATTQLRYTFIVIVTSSFSSKL